MARPSIVDLISEGAMRLENSAGLPPSAVTIEAQLPKVPGGDISDIKAKGAAPVSTSECRPSFARS